MTVHMRFVDLDLTRPISVIGLGTWQFGSREWGYGADYDQGEAARIVRRAVELGVTLFDTAEIYGRGRSERILGAALRDAGADPDRVVVATKIFPVLPIAPVVQQRAVASAERLGVRRIDLYQVHQPNPVVRDDTTMRGMRVLRSIGLVDQVGVSNYSLQRWQAAEAALGSPVLSNQVQYSLAHPQPEADLVPYAERERRLVIAWSPLAQGLLSGRYDEQHRPANGIRSMNPLFLTENLRRATPLIRTLREVADAHEATCSQIALAWLVRHGCVAAIPGASSVEQLERNVAAADLVLKADESTALTEASRAFHPLSGRAAVGPLLRSRLHR
ncbi:MAG TPA: aldo/keto reductase [Kineosporiaceae bacterium]|nr:aldo/keto reductase [Kineosporiaceae bacterium]